MKKKVSCKHPKIPAYTDSEKLTVDWLNGGIVLGDSGLYMLLSRLAVKTAVDEGRFTRETCQECEEKC